MLIYCTKAPRDEPWKGDGGRARGGAASRLIKTETAMRAWGMEEESPAPPWNIHLLRVNNWCSTKDRCMGDRQTNGWKKNKRDRQIKRESPISPGSVVTNLPFHLLPCHSIQREAWLHLLHHLPTHLIPSAHVMHTSANGKLKPSLTSSSIQIKKIKKHILLKQHYSWHQQLLRPFHTFFSRAFQSQNSSIVVVICWS